MLGYRIRLVSEKLSVLDEIRPFARRCQALIAARTLKRRRPAQPHLTRLRRHTEGPPQVRVTLRAELSSCGACLGADLDGDVPTSSWR